MQTFSSIQVNRPFSFYSPQLAHKLPENTFYKIVTSAAQQMNTPMAVLFLVDRQGCFIKSRLGIPSHWLNSKEMQLSKAFCQHVIASKQNLFISDRSQYSYEIPKTDSLQFPITAYAAVPLMLPTKMIIGALCVLDSKARQWVSSEIDILQNIAISGVDIIQKQMGLYRETHRLPMQNRRDVFLNSERNFSSNRFEIDSSEYSTRTIGNATQVRVTPRFIK